jgi:hypothetical protein
VHGAAASAAPTAPQSGTTNYPGWVSAIERDFGRDGIDLIIDPVVGASTASGSRATAAPGSPDAATAKAAAPPSPPVSYLEGNGKVLATDGSIVILAMMGGSKLPNAVDLSPFFRKRAAIQFSTLRSRSFEYKAQLAADFAALLVPHFVPTLEEASGVWGAGAGSDKRAALAPVIHAVLPVEQIGEAHRIVESGESIGKVVLKF